MDRPEFIDYAFVRIFLAQLHQVDQTKASNMTYDLLLRLFDIPSVTFICRDCKKIRGECRCLKHGRQDSAGWYYTSKASPWLCTVSTLLSLKRIDLEQLPPVTKMRVEALTKRLSELPR